MKHRNQLASKLMKERALHGSLAVALVAVLVSSAFVPGWAEAKTAAKKLSEEQKILHVLNRLGFGPRAGDVEKVKRQGLDKYIESQLYPERLDDVALEARLAAFPSLKMEIAEINEQYPQPQDIARKLGLRLPGQLNPQAPLNEPSDKMDSEEARESERQQREYRQQIFAYYRDNKVKPPQFILQELQGQKIVRAVYSERQLQEVMTDFWFNHFNIFWAKGADRMLTTDFEINAIRPHTFGKFKDLLMATAKSSAMMFYLDNFQSMTPNPQMPRRGEVPNRALRRLRQQPVGNRNQQPNQNGQEPAPRQMSEDEQRRQQALNQQRNRQRGINENYAREIMELHTLGVDGGYTQKDVQEVARCFTGWTIDRPQVNGKFIFREFMHDKGEKVVLGQAINEGGIKDGERVIEILARHASTAKFISTKLARKFVSDAPPPSLVEKLAKVYAKTDGDIREMLRTLFTSSEFTSADAYRAKIKSPFELAVSAIRALNAELVTPLQTAQFVARMGQPLYLYQAPTGYPDRAEQWINTGALLERLNFGLALSTNRLQGAKIEVKSIAPNLAGSDSQAVMNRAIALLLNHDVSPQTRTILDKQLKEGVSVSGQLDAQPSAAMRPNQPDAEMLAGQDPASRPNGPGARLQRLSEAARATNQPALTGADLEIAKVFGLVLGSPEFQRR